MKLAAIFLCLVAVASAEDVILSRFMRPTGLERFRNIFRAMDFERITGGNEVEPHSHPYQVGLLLTIGDKTAFCGGSLISRNFVLTAAHCVYDGRNTVTQFTIVLGAHNIYDEENTIRYISKTAIMHPGWNPKTLQNDLALIRIPVEVDITDKVQLISLPPYSAVGQTFSGYGSTVTGWGKPSDSNNQLSPVLREVSNDIMSNTMCGLRYPGVLQTSHVCMSGANGKSSCNGDSGGPLTAVFKGKKIQVGIVSFGIILGCEKGWPAVFTRVTSYLDWISSNSGAPIPPM